MRSWLLITIAFIAASALAFMVDAWVLVPLQRAKSIRRRLIPDAASVSKTAPSLLWRPTDEMFAFLPGTVLRRMIRQAGVRLDDTRMQNVASLTFPGLIALLTALSTIDLRWGLVSSIALTLAAWLLLRQLRRRRLNRFGTILPDIIDVIARDLRAGLPLVKALVSVGHTFHNEAGAEFALVASEVAYGSDVAESFQRLSDRVGHPELDLLLAALRIGFQTGGDLTPILAKLSATIRKRIQMKKKLYALTAEMRLTAHILTALPVGVFVLINIFSASYYGEVWDRDIVWKTLLGCMVALGFGNFVVRRMIDQQV